MAGAVYDQTLEKWMRNKQLINHPDPKIRALWNGGNEKEYGPVGSSTPGIGYCFVSWNFVFVYEVEDILSLGSIETLEEASIFFFISPIP